MNRQTDRYIGRLSDSMESFRDSGILTPYNRQGFHATISRVRCHSGVTFMDACDQGLPYLGHIHFSVFIMEGTPLHVH